MSTATPPRTIVVRTESKLLHVEFDDGAAFDLSFEYLRVHSPSAEVRGHGAGQAVLQTGKEGVGLARIEPVGRYAVRLVFDDGHDSGLYTWKYLRELGEQRDRRWSDYLDRLAAAGYARRPDGPT